MLPTVRTTHLAVAAALFAASCGGPPDETWEGLERILGPLEAYGLRPKASDDALAQLAWQAPTDACPHVYRLHASYEPPQLHEQDSVSTLALGPAPASARGHVELAEGAPIPEGVVAELRLYYQGLRAEKRGTSRDVFASATEYGPSAPTAACFPRTWDPMEDALALGWPRLPDHAVIIGEHWTGARVQGKCARSPCVDPQSGGGGEDQHDRACVSMSWAERLGRVCSSSVANASRWSSSHWDDGHDGQGISTDRLTLISIDHGRPTWSRTIVDHRFPQLAADQHLPAGGAHVGARERRRVSGLAGFDRLAAARGGHRSGRRRDRAAAEYRRAAQA